MVSIRLVSAVSSIYNSPSGNCNTHRGVNQAWRTLKAALNPWMCWRKVRCRSYAALVLQYTAGQTVQIDLTSFSSDAFFYFFIYFNATGSSLDFPPSSMSIVAMNSGSRAARAFHTG